MPSGVGAETKLPESGLIDVDLTLRTQQADYLEYLADRDETNEAVAFRRILDKRMASQSGIPPSPPQKVRKHYTVMGYHLEFIDRMAAWWGLPRSDVVRRLIDEALSKDTTI
jgi:hypothetical protein